MNLTFSEPLSQTLTLVLNYGGLNTVCADRNTYNPSAQGKYDLLVDSLSSNYSFNQFLNHAGAPLIIKKIR